MERGPFLNPKIQKEFGRYVGLVLHTDGKDEKYGESSQRNLTLLQERFKTKALPYYVITDSTGKKVLWTSGYNENVDAVVKALQAGKANP